MTGPIRGKREVPGRDGRPAKVIPPAPVEAAQLSRFYILEGGCLFDVVSGGLYRLSSSAAFLLDQYRSGKPPDQLAVALERRYGIGHEVAMRDAQLFLNQMATLNLEDQGENVTDA